jgi:integrase/recombinase XerC/integrase/recombinase XerD
MNWIVAEGGIDGSPMATVKAPIDRPDQILPFTQEQVTQILAASQKTSHPKRDYAICLFLLDTGLRVSELCSLKFGQLDMLAKTALVEGKGQKKRSIYFGRQTSKALWSYLREEVRDPEQAVFINDTGINAGHTMSRNGVLLMMRRLAKIANIPTVRLSPHTFRHTFAIEFLRNGGNQFTLMALLGHTDVKMTQRYVTYAQADIAAQHRINSPVDRMRRQN